MEFLLNSSFSIARRAFSSLALLAVLKFNERSSAFVRNSVLSSLDSADSVSKSTTSVLSPSISEGNEIPVASLSCLSCSTCSLSN